MKALKDNGKSFDDVYWIGCKDFVISKSNFLRCADVLYDNGFGGIEVAADLMIVGSDWWLERHDYDGAEWWEYKEICPIPNKVKVVETLVRTPETEDRRWSEYSDDTENHLIHMCKSIQKESGDQYRY